MNRFEIIQLPSKYISEKAAIKFKLASKDLRLLKQKLQVNNICIRGGFIIDTLIGKNPKDIDIFYISQNALSTQKESCICDSFKNTYLTLKNDLSLISNYEIDWGHYGKNELVLPLVECICGYLTQSLDFLSLFVLDINGKVWTNKYGLYCFQNQIWEITPMTWMTYSHFMADKPVDFYDLYTGICLKVIRHIKEGKANKIGPMTKELLENFHYVLQKIKPESERGKNIVGRFNKNELSLVDLKKILAILEIETSELIMIQFSRIIG